VLQGVGAPPTRLRRGFELLGFAFERTPDRFEIIGQLEACDACASESIAWLR
jgi:hypothetical protein